jgi:hypothetical protein
MSRHQTHKELVHPVLGIAVIICPNLSAEYTVDTVTSVSGARPSISSSSYTEAPAKPHNAAPNVLSNLKVIKSSALDILKERASDHESQRKVNNYCRYKLSDGLSGRLGEYLTALFNYYCSHKGGNISGAGFESCWKLL